MKKVFLLFIIVLSSCVQQVEIEIYSDDGHIFEIINIEQVQTKMLFGPDKNECKMTLKSRRNDNASDSSKDKTVYIVYFKDACIKYQVGDIMELKLAK